MNTSRVSTKLAAAAIALPALLLGILSAEAGPQAGKQKRTGVQVYKQECASCHGPDGKGTKSFNKPLIGTRSPGELARFIHQTMPPGAPKKLPLADARVVADYIHGAFYSPVAQARLKPPRVELSRLTVRQYRNAVMDLVGSFRPEAKLDDRRGLRGEYFKAGRARGNERVLERVDPEVRFDFGAKGALDEQADPYQFSMRWEGSVLAPDSGEYEFIVHTDQAARLWVNDLRQPLVDAYVKSGNTNEYRGVITLVGGRAYPLRMEFSKGVVGVDNIEKVKQKPPQNAFLRLEWKRPKLAAEVIPQRALSPVVTPEAYVSATPFPPDDRSLGYERGSAISKEWDHATTDAAMEAAAYIAPRLRELAGAADNAPDRAEKVRAFCRRFVERAFRRPLTDELAETYVERHLKAAPNPESAVRRVVLLTLKSPRFLFREVSGGTPDAWDVASRLSFALWDSLPDEALLKAASAGELGTREQVGKHAERMVGDLRARAKLRDFFLQWLKVDHVPELAKDAKLFPGFDDAVATDLRTSLELMFEDVVWSEKSDFRELMQTDRLYLNGRLARLYGASLPSDAPFQPVPIDSAERAGVVTHPYLLATLAYLDTSSPIHRGVLIARSLMGRTLQPPPEAFTPVPAKLHPKLTTRQRVAMQTKPAACASCHDLINPLGFSLEKFDAIGRLRNVENGVPVDATGSYRSRAGTLVKFRGGRDLGRFIAESDEAQLAFTEKLFQYMVKQPVRAYGPAALPGMRKTFAANQYNIRKQVVETVTTAALRR